MGAADGTVVGITKTAAHRSWNHARAWLYCEIAP